MSCEALAAAAFLWLAAAPPAVAPTSPHVAAPSGAAAHEPLFADILKRAENLSAEVTALRAGGKAPSEDFKARIRDLAAMDMQGHVVLRERGTDGDLKCILKGIAQDLPLKLAAVDAARTPQDRDGALADMGYLLNDNVEVIAAPPAPPV